MNGKGPLPESLFEKLAAQFEDGTAVSTVPPDKRRAKSIRDHLWRMFNTRQGTIPHMPEYGLPDISSVYSNPEAGIRELEDTIVKLTSKYEPRLERVRIHPIKTDPSEFRLAFELTAIIKGGDPIAFETSFSTTGETKVAPVKPRNRDRG